MAELLAQVADKIDRAVQRVTPFAYRMQRKGRRWMRRAMRKPRSVSEGPNLLPLLIQVLASFSKADGVLLEEEIDSSLGFLRYDYPEALWLVEAVYGGGMVEANVMLRSLIAQVELLFLRDHDLIILDYVRS